jgi:cyclophilin family peptidyl-prolyl cis-trans isomerase
MSKNKQTSKKKSQKVQQPQNADKTIQYIAIAVIVIVAAFIAWRYIPKPQPKADVPAFGDSTSSASVCKEFDSIPTAAQYEAPPMKVDQAKQYFANFKMAKGGNFVIELYPAKAPITVNSFVFLSCKGYFNGLTFHRVLEGFMAQGGDPTGSGAGGPGYEFVNEDSDLTFDKAGVMAMANSGRDTNGSQFFITFGPTEQLNGAYTIFGQVVEGMDVVNAITFRDPGQNPTFEGDVMESVTISEK